MNDDLLPSSCGPAPEIVLSERTVTMEDGRYLIYFTFDEEGSGETDV